MGCTNFLQTWEFVATYLPTYPSSKAAWPLQQIRKDCVASEMDQGALDAEKIVSCESGWESWLLEFFLLQVLYTSVHRNFVNGQEAIWLHWIYNTVYKQLHMPSHSCKLLNLEWYLYIEHTLQSYHAKCLLGVRSGSLQTSPYTTWIEVSNSPHKGPNTIITC